jgi:hypothetical protein
MKIVLKILGVILIIFLVFITIEYFVMSKNSEKTDQLLIKKKK